MRRPKQRVAADLPPYRVRLVTRNCSTCKFMEFDGECGWDCTRPSGFYKDAGDYNPAVFVCDRWVKVNDSAAEAAEGDE